MNLLLEALHKTLLTEGFAASHYMDEVYNVMNKFFEDKQRYDESVKYGRTQFTYQIHIDLSKIIQVPETTDEEAEETDAYYNVVVSYSPENSSTNQGSFDKDWEVIFMRLGNTITKEEFVEILSHETTHLIDMKIMRLKNVKTPLYSYNYETVVGCQFPRCIKMLLYYLWTPTEFNAHQTMKYLPPEEMNQLIDFLMKCLEATYQLDDQYLWYKIQSVVRRTYNKNQREIKGMYKDTTPTFKKYFITTSFKLLKKFIKKAM